MELAMVIQERRYKVNDFEEFLALSENRDRLFELVDGEIVQKMPTREHGIIVGNIVTEFNLYLRQNPIGRAAVEARHRPANDDENDRLPDISFVSGLDKPVERKGPALYMPDLAVEVKSPDDSNKEMRAKADYYLANGSRMVWLVYPDKRLVEVHTADDFQIHTIDDTLDGGDVLPGFKLAVRDVFRM
jgi:Uma2 family endonuclease